MNLEPDHILLDWLDKAKRLSASLWLQVWHTIARMFLSAFMTQTDVNGYYIFVNYMPITMTYLFLCSGSQL